MRTKVVLAALVVVTIAVIAFAPLVSSSSCTTRSPNRVTRCETGTDSLIADQPGPVLLIASVIGALALVAIVSRRVWLKGAVATLLTVAMVVGAASVGLLLIPLVLAAWANAMSSAAEPRPT